MAVIMNSVSITGKVSMGSGEAVDPDFADVILLMHFTGADDSYTAIDSSSYANLMNFAPAIPPTAARIKTDQYQFGPSSMFGEGYGYIINSDPNEAIWAFGSEDFTVEGWIRIPSGNQTAIFSTIMSIPGSNVGTFIGTNGSGQLDFGVGGTSYDAITDGSVLTADTWYYVAGVRSGNTLYLFRDGVLIGTTSTTQVLNTQDCRIGSRFIDTGDYFTALYGNIDELRVTRGVARYTSNFAVPTAPFPNS